MLGSAIDLAKISTAEGSGGCAGGTHHSHNSHKKHQHQNASHQSTKEAENNTTVQVRVESVEDMEDDCSYVYPHATAEDGIQTVERVPGDSYV